MGGCCKAAQLQEVIRNSSFPYFSAISLQSPSRTAEYLKGVLVGISWNCHSLRREPSMPLYIYAINGSFGTGVVTTATFGCTGKGKWALKSSWKEGCRCPSSRRRAWTRKYKWHDWAQREGLKVRSTLMGQYQLLAFYALMLNACLKQPSVPMQNITEPGV